MSARPANSLERYISLFQRQKNKTVLDYGSGNLRNSIYLQNNGYDVYAVDLPHRTKINCLPRLNCILPEELDNLTSQFGLIICTFVLNLIKESERTYFLENLTKKVIDGGYLLIETKGFSLVELDRMFIPRGFYRINYEKGRYTIIVLYRYYHIN